MVIVYNCCPSSKKGHHWVAIFYNQGSVEFFDSFTSPPWVYDAWLTTFLHHTTGAREVLFTNEPLQEADSDACGHYGILCGVVRSKGDTFHNIVKEMSTLTRDNWLNLL